MNIKNYSIRLVTTVMLIVFLSACNSPGYSLIPDKYIFPELVKLSQDKRFLEREYRDSFFADKQSFVLQNSNKYYLFILKDPDLLYERCRPAPANFIHEGRAVFIQCGTQRLNRIVRTYQFEDKEQMEEYAIRLNALI